MAAGDLYEATAGASDDIYYVDLAMFGAEQFGTAYIIDAERPALVDTGLGADRELILSAMARVGIAPTDLAVIAPTHVHLDHAGGAGYLAEACPNATVHVYEAGGRFLTDPEPIWAGTQEVVGERIEYYAKPVPVPEDRLVEHADGDVIDLGDHALEVHHAPGHTFHQAVFYELTSDGIFTADAAGICTPVMETPRQTTPPADFDLEECLADVDTMRDLDARALYFPHFGDRETGTLLESYAETLKNWVERVANRRAALGDDEAVVEHFTDAAPEVSTTAGWGAEHVRAEERLSVRGVLQYLESRGD